MSCTDQIQDPHTAASECHISPSIYSAVSDLLMNTTSAPHSILIVFADLCLLLICSYAKVELMLFTIQTSVNVIFCPVLPWQLFLSSYMIVERKKKLFFSPRLSTIVSFQ